MKRPRLLIRLPVLVAALALAPVVKAAATQDEVLRSINENVGASIDPSKLVATLLAIVGVIVVIALLTHRRKGAVVPKALNHQGRLLKDIARRVNLRPSEVRQLKLLAEEEELSSPLVLLLCPSVLTSAIKHSEQKLDRKALAGVAQRLTAK